MFFAKLLNKIPFFRNRRIKKLKRELAEVNKDFTDGFFNDKYIISIHNILNTSLIAFSDDLVANSTEKLSLYSKTSMNALRLLDKKIFKKSILERSPLLSLTLTPNYFTSWYSNEESVVMLVGIMKEYIAANVLRIQSSEYEDSIALDEHLNSENQEFLDSLLYRLLLADLVTILIFYLETKYD